MWHFWIYLDWNKVIFIITSQEDLCSLWNVLDSDKTWMHTLYNSQINNCLICEVWPRQVELQVGEAVEPLWRDQCRGREPALRRASLWELHRAHRKVTELSCLQSTPRPLLNICYGSYMLPGTGDLKARRTQPLFLRSSPFRGTGALATGPGRCHREDGTNIQEGPQD